VPSGNVTWTPRGVDAQPVEVLSAGEYLDIVKRLGVELSVEARRRLILEQSRALAESAGGRLDEDADLLEEVTNLVEYPTPVLGSFDPAALDAPAEALITVMKRHQRYFPVYGPDGKLLPRFVAVANGKRQRPEIIAHGNE